MATRPQEPDTLLRDHLSSAFRRTFAREEVKIFLLFLVDALRESRPALSLIRRCPEPLPSLFTPFHGEAVFPLNIKGMIARNELHPHLADFCRVCGTLELLTSKFPLRTVELTERERVTLLKVLTHFLSILPTEEDFLLWLKE